MKRIEGFIATNAYIAVRPGDV